MSAAEYVEMRCAAGTISDHAHTLELGGGMVQNVVRLSPPSSSLSVPLPVPAATSVKVQSFSVSTEQDCRY